MPRETYTPFGQQFTRGLSLAAGLPDRIAQVPTQNRLPLRANFTHHNNGGATLTVNGQRVDAVLSDATIRQKYQERGALIQGHERRLKDCNQLLNQMKQRLDPDQEVEGSMINPDVSRKINNQRKQSFSQNEHMQSFYNFVAAYDIMHGGRSRQQILAAEQQPKPSNEKRVESMAATIRIQGGLIQEQTEIIERLKQALIASRATLPDNLLSSRVKLPSKPPIPDKTRVDRLAVGRSGVSNKKGKPIPKFRPSAFKLENHDSLTFNGFSEQNQVNPARLQMMEDRRASASRSSSVTPMQLDDEFIMNGPLRTGANTSYVGNRRRSRNEGKPDSRDSPALSASGTDLLPIGPGKSRGTGYPRSPNYFFEGVEIAMSGSSEPIDRSDTGSKRAMPFLDYDDKPDISKRVKSGALTPPPPEELTVQAPKKAVVAGADPSGGVRINFDGGHDLEMGEIVEHGPQTAAAVAADADSKFSYEGLEEMISEAKAKAKATT